MGALQLDLYIMYLISKEAFGARYGIVVQSMQKHHACTSHGNNVMVHVVLGQGHAIFRIDPSCTRCECHLAHSNLDPHHFA